MGSSARTVTDTARQKAVEHHISRAVMILPPWVGAVLLLPLGAVLHARFHTWWAVASVLAAAAGLGALAWHIGHEHTTLHRAHGAGTAAAWGVWLAVAAGVGRWGQGVWFAYLMAAIVVALSWNMRGLSRHSAHTDAIARALEGAAEQADMPGASFTITAKKPGTRVIKAKARGVPGQHTGDHFRDRARLIESGAGLPPGSLAFTQDDSDAAAANVTLSDPRGIDRPMPWPGPSRPGQSAALPLRIGITTPGEALEIVLRTHLGVFGTSGSAKTTGAMYNILGELVTRTDADVFGMDPAKGRQFLGAWEPCLAEWHGKRIITDPQDVAPFLTWAREQIKPRTDRLAELGLPEWRQGATWADGRPMRLMVVWMEEGPECLEYAGDDGTEQWARSLKVSRTAGILYVFSGQRPDWSQMPTIARAQINGRLVFGVADDKDADICLSSRQTKAGCTPEDWGVRHPGKCYADTPDIPDDLVAVACRTYFWGDTDAACREHAARYANTRTEEAPVPEPRDIIPEWQEPPGPAGPAAEEVTAEVLGGDDDPIGGTLDVPPGTRNWEWESGEPDPPPPADPLAALEAWIAERGQAEFGAKDLAELRIATGRGRSWVYDRLMEKVATGKLARTAKGWRAAA